MRFPKYTSKRRHSSLSNPSVGLTRISRGIGIVIGITAIVSASLFAMFVVPPLLFPTGDEYDRMPDFTLTACNGTTFTLSDYEGKVVLLIFMQTSNADSIQGIPELIEVRQSYTSDLVMISISTGGDTCASLTAFAETHGIDWLLAVDTATSRSVAGDYGISNIPTHMILDQHRQLNASLPGYVSAATLRYVIDPLLLSPEVYGMMPDFTLTTYDGITFTLSEIMEGRPVLLIFFRTSCPYCIEELPELVQVRQNYGDDLLMISISTSGDTDVTLEELAGTNGMDWLIARDTAGVSRDYGIMYVPTHVILDQGRLEENRVIGSTSADYLISQIDPLMTPHLQRSQTCLVGDAAPISIPDNEALRYIIK